MREATHNAIQALADHRALLDDRRGGRPGDTLHDWEEGITTSELMHR